MSLTCFSKMRGGREEKRNRMDILINQIIFFVLHFSVGDGEKWPGKHLTLYTQATDSIHVVVMQLVSQNRTCFETLPNLPKFGRFGRTRLAETLSTKHWYTMRDSLWSWGTDQSCHRASLELVSHFWRELGAIVANRVWSTSLLSGLSLD